MTDHVRTIGISLRRWLVAAALGLLSLSSWASFPATTTFTVGDAFATTGSSAAAACTNSGNNYKTSWQRPSAVGTLASANTCNVSGIGVFTITGGAPSCPANSTISGSTCTCGAAYSESNGTCVARDFIKELNASGGAVVGDGPCGLSKCWQSPGGGGLKVRGTGASCWKSKTTGKNMFEVYGPFVADGGACTETPTTGSGATPTAPATPSPADCAGYWGSVNGVDQCVPKSTSPGTSGSTSDDSSKTTTDSTGTTTTTTKGDVTCFDGTCTTTKTTTTTPPGGTATTSTSTSTQPQTAYCKDNPAAAVCKAADDVCVKNPELVQCMTKGTPDDGVKLSKVDSGFTSITAVSFTSASGCPADLPFTVKGHTYSMSYASMCNTASTYGAPVVLILGTALAAFIFIGGFRT